jgi:hypothetical protein
VHDPGPGPSARRDTPIRIGAVLALAIAIGFVVWLFVRGDDDSSSKKATVGPTPTTTATTTTTSGRKLLTAASPQTLKTLAAASNRPIYWAGARARTTYELTRTPDGRVYVRYLPKGVKVGDTRANFLIVATYPVPNAYKAVQTAAKEDGAVKIRLPRHGLAVYNRSSETNVYFAYPGTDFQVEVYDPNPRRARRLVSSGKIRPIS